ncbi:MAG TPA: preprotein translocase subunit SecE [Solirubrobacteraceae bacterium]|nr:preprotein translocase subunit SecE [Solirubrobacteraceae bacterium]
MASRRRDGRPAPVAPPDLPDRDEAMEQAEQEVVPGPTSARPHELAPDPLQHAAPDVELADEHVAFGSRVVADGHPAAADELSTRDEELLEEEIQDQRERRAAAAPAVSHERPSLFARLIGFLEGSWRELQRVQWPDRRQVAQATGVVIGFVIVAGVFLGLADLAFSHLVNFVLK